MRKSDSAALIAPLSWRMASALKSFSSLSSSAESLLAMPSTEVSFEWVRMAPPGNDPTQTANSSATAASLIVSECFLLLIISSPFGNSRRRLP